MDTLKDVLIIPNPLFL